MQPGEVVAVIGPSGSGKSSLPSCIHFLEPFDSGTSCSTADRVVFMEAGQVVEIAPPQELFACPRSERTREFLGAAMAE